MQRAFSQPKPRLRSRHKFSAGQIKLAVAEARLIFIIAVHIRQHPPAFPEIPIFVHPMLHITFARIAKIHKSGSGTAWDSLRFQNGAKQNGCLPAGYGDSFHHIPVLRKSRAVQPQNARNHGDSRNIQFVLIFKTALRVGRKFPIVILFQIGRNFCEIHGRVRDLVADQHSYGRYVVRQGQHKISV